MSKGKIFVFLAAGDQGKSACKYLHEDGFQVVGLTRHPDGDAAKSELVFPADNACDVGKGTALS